MATLCEDQVVPGTRAFLEMGLPNNWEVQSQCVETFDLATTSEEWKN